MSELTEYLQGEIHAMHGLYDRVTKDLDDTMLNHVPPGGHQSIAFCLWHYVRTEDNAIQFVIQRKPTVWMEGGWDATFGLDSKSQGTGFTDDDARSLRINGIGPIPRVHGAGVPAHRGLRRRPIARRSRARDHRQAAGRDVDPPGHLGAVHDPRLPPPRRDRVREGPRSAKGRRHD